MKKKTSIKKPEKIPNFTTTKVENNNQPSVIKKVVHNQGKK